MTHRQHGRRPRRIAAALSILAATALCAPLAVQARDGDGRPGDDKGPGPGSALCGERSAGVQCGPGNNRRTAGGGDTGNVPHADGAGRRWPAVSGILWKVLDSGDRTKQGGADNDELLGHHGDETLVGGRGDDILWGDWDPHGNSKRQHDVLSGGAGNDWLYPSHGRSSVRGGAGRDYVWAFYGKGKIDCGPGKDIVRVRRNGAFTTRNCETIQHFCAFGSAPGGGCRKPGGARASRRR